MTTRADTPAQPTPFIADRIVLLAACAIIATVNARAHHGIAMVARDGLWAALSDLFGNSAILWFALYALVAIALSGSRADTPPPGRGDWSVAAAMIAASMLPLPALAAFGLLGGATYLFVTSAAGEGARRIAIVMLAICGHVLIGRLALAVFSGPLLAMDAQAVAWLGGTSAEGNVVRFVDGTAFVVSGACSSLHNMSLGVLCWATLTQLFALRIDRRLTGFLALTLAGLFCVNAFRLAAIARLPDHYQLLHHGWGATLFGIASLCVIAALSAWGVLDASRRQA